MIFLVSYVFVVRYRWFGRFVFLGGLDSEYFGVRCYFGIGSDRGYSCVVRERVGGVSLSAEALYFCSGYECFIGLL